MIQVQHMAVIAKKEAPAPVVDSDAWEDTIDDAWEDTIDDAWEDS